MAITNRYPLCIAAVSLFLATALTTPLMAVTTNQVGAGKTYSTIQAAVSASANGDVVEIYPGTYSGAAAVAVINNSITIRGIGTRPVLDATSYTIPNGKAIFEASGPDITIENIEFMGAAVPDNNGAGIRPEGAKLTVRHCYFHDNQDGMVGGAVNSQFLIEYCEFARNGAGDGQSHNIYVNNIGKLTFQYNYSHNASTGHLFKSRAYVNYILYNRLTDETGGNASYELDVPQGGLTYIIGNLIEQCPTTQNHGMINFYEECPPHGTATPNPTNIAYICNNTIVNDYGGGTVINNASTSAAVVINNIFVGGGTLFSGLGTPTNNLSLNGTQLVNRASYDYHLIPYSSAIDWGVTPGVYSNFDLTPAYVYVHPTTCAVRQVMAALDVGAYEATDPGSAYLHLTSLYKTNNNLYVNWLGNNAMSQILECKTNLFDSTWKLVSSNAPTATPYYAKTFVTNSPEIFFRIRATH
jgi:hypothetical protein